METTVKMKIEEVGLKDDKGKLRMDLIPPIAIISLAECLTYGAIKYKPNSWQNVNNSEDVHYAALMRHLMQWRSGIKIDEESKISHLKLAFSNLMFLVHNEG